MDRLTFTKEYKEDEKIGAIKYVKPEILAIWEERLSAYEDNDQTPEQQANMIKENEMLRAEIDEIKAKYEQPKEGNFKVRCISSPYGYFTEGDIYDVIDGHIRYDDGEFDINKFDSVESLNAALNSQFVLYVEPEGDK